MARFRFALESLLRKRHVDEDEAQRGLAKALRARMIIMTQLRSEQQTILDSKSQLADSLTGKVDLAAVGRFAHYSGQVSQRAHGMVVRLSAVEKQILEAQMLLEQAVRARKSIELLRQRRLDVWRRDQRRRQTAQLDESALQRHIRGDAMGAGA